MARRPSADFRERLAAAVDAGLPPGEAAIRFRVSIRSVYRWLARYRRGEPMADQPRSGRPPKLGADGDEMLRAQAAAHPDATLPEHAARLEAATGVHLSLNMGFPPADIADVGPSVIAYGATQAEVDAAADDMSVDGFRDEMRIRQGDWYDPPANVEDVRRLRYRHIQTPGDLRERRKEQVSKRVATQTITFLETIFE